MSKQSRRPNREEIKRKRKQKKWAENVLRSNQKKEGLEPVTSATISNGKSAYKTVEEEKEARMEAVTEQVMIFRSKLPILLNRLSRITDPRNPKKIKHKLAVLMIYGILTFVLQMASRREVNREITRPQFMENLKLLFPELESIPHNDTLMRLLSRIEVNEIESIHVELIRRFIRKKKFRRYLIDNCYPIAVDGTQKFFRNWLWSEECLERNVKNGKEREKQYYVYVLEANLAFHNGMTIPLMSEFLNYAEGDTENSKQDCEMKAFHRLAVRLKKEFPNLSIMILLDGLYPKGPIIERCLKNNWQYMIVLKDKCMPYVWEEYEGLKKLEPVDNLKMCWGNRRQHFEWVNDIEYCYSPGENKKQIIHLVVCSESWEEFDEKAGRVLTKSARHAWISSKPLNEKNVHERCNLGARHRWGIESGILVEKCHGYQYEHCFSYDWNAMKGYHYLMRLGHMLNVLAQYSVHLAEFIENLGVRGFIKFVRDTIKAPWLDASRVKERLALPFQLRLI